MISILSELASPQIYHVLPRPRREKNMETRLCRKCNEPRPITNFKLVAKSQWGLDGVPRRGMICRQCIKNKNKELGLCACGRPRKSGILRCESCSNSNRKTHTTRHRLDRDLAIKKYGGKCAFCGESRPFFLSIDHTNDDGAQHRKELTSDGSIYRWLRMNDYPKDRFQLACHNCNMTKSIYGEEQLRRWLTVEN